MQAGKQINTPVGTVFRQLTTTGNPFRHGQVTYVECLCTCGITKTIPTNRLYRKTRPLQTCGHRRNRLDVFKSEAYAWANIKQRCYNQNRPDYGRYGGRGITVCGRWLNSFNNFLADMGHRPSAKHSIERIDNNKGYSPENCKWGTHEEQARNKRNTHILTFQSRTMRIDEWTEFTGIRAGTIRQRLWRGWSVERTLSTPLHARTVS